MLELESFITGILVGIALAVLLGLKFGDKDLNE
ncbi:MAG: hypothetical protein RUMPE_01343 [Eubacteriales bacterium SKADARSKE-1]|nr:hypothetical protein [Eubacteriales bacterium SKADARSKE-1]MDQ5984296.1 hypothetical protein [Eubacteriales bacterium SKADARSKE-1]